MLDAVKVLFILTSTSAYLVTKYVSNSGENRTESLAKDKTIKEPMNSKEVSVDHMTNGSDVDLWTKNTTVFHENYELQVLEEDKDLPKALLRISGVTTGGSVEGIMYLLSGDGVNEDNPEDSKFAINAFSGELFLISALNRDPPDGRPLYRLNISAEDDNGRRVDGWTSVAIRVVDINDNWPQFSRDNYWANVSENSESGEEITVLTAEDSDRNDVIRYAIEMNRVDSSGQLIFQINELSGQLSLAVCCLDRETTDHYNIRVCATDGPHKTCARVTVTVTDQNDQKPEFTLKSIAVAANVRQLRSGKVLARVWVSDGDLLATNEFAFKVLEFSYLAKHFSLIAATDVPNSAHLVVSNDVTEKELFIESNVCVVLLTLVVTDSGDFTDQSRVDYCSVQLTITQDVSEATDEPKVDNRTTIAPNITSNEVVVNESREVANNWWTEVMPKVALKVILFFTSLPLLFVLLLLFFRHKRPNTSTDERNSGFTEQWMDSIVRYDCECGEWENWNYDLSALQRPISADNTKSSSSAVLLLPDVLLLAQNETKG